jgi:hypothetical protein
MEVIQMNAMLFQKENGSNLIRQRDTSQKGTEMLPFWENAIDQ